MYLFLVFTKLSINGYNFLEHGFLNVYRDRIRTTVNVWGDSLGAAIIEHLSRKDLLAVDYGNEPLPGAADRTEGHEMDEVTPLENATD